MSDFLSICKYKIKKKTQNFFEKTKNKIENLIEKKFGFFVDYDTAFYYYADQEDKKHKHPQKKKISHKATSILFEIAIGVAIYIISSLIISFFNN